MAAFSLAGCREKTPRSPSPPAESPPATSDARTQAEADVYHARGVVEQLPAANEPDHSIYIRHEPLSDFRDRNGKTVGMKSMTMPFPVAPSVPLTGIAAGDTVSFTFEVRWKPTPGFRLTEIARLPAGTRLDFGTGGAPH